MWLKGEREREREAEGERQQLRERERAKEREGVRETTGYEPLRAAQTVVAGEGLTDLMWEARWV